MITEKSSQRLCRARCTAVVITLLLAFRPSVEAATTTKDKVQSYEGVLHANATFTSSGGGHTAGTGDYAIDLTPQGGYVAVSGASFLNAATVNDEITIALWIKKYDIAASSAFWIDSPSEGRVDQAHVPWNDNIIYYDTGSGADGRISADIATFPDYTGDATDISWWTNKWHFFVFSKKADVKQIWIDGKLFLEGSNPLALKSDIGRFSIGGDTGGGNLMHGLIDDFSIFSKALTEADITNLFAGTLPTALPAASGLMAYWDFNDYPADGVFSGVVPAPDATDADPNLIQIVHRDGATPWTTNNVSLKVDDAQVASTFTKAGDIATVRYVPDPFFAAQSKHTAALLYPGPTGAPKTLEWRFTVGVYTKDRIQSRLGVFREFGAYTDNGGGHTAQPGDYAADLSRQGGAVAVSDASFLNAASTNDELTVALWVKKYDIVDSSAFWIDSPSEDRVFQAHTPWSDNVIYFDTSGCCGASTERISADIATFPDYTGDISWWKNWRFFVFSKKADVKQIWIDGKLFLQGSSTDVLATDIGRLMIGGDTFGGDRMHALVDDLSIFSTALAEADITNLFQGTLPTALPSSSGLLAYWDFNDIPPLGQFTTIFPTPDSTNAPPNLVKVVHLDGTSTWDQTKVSLKVDGAVVPATVSKAGGFVTVSYVPSPIFPMRTAHTAMLLYDTAVVSEWQFTVGAYTKDLVLSNFGVLEGAAVFTPDRGGKSGNAGDFGIDFGQADAGQAVHIFDATFLNPAATNDELAVVSWQKLYQIANSALFWGVSYSTVAGSRGFFVATPWSDSVLYFDTAGCCDPDTQRISADIATFPDYTGDVGWWTNWHHLVVQKKLSTKEIWIDGKLFLTGDNTNSLPTDFTEAWLGFDPPDNARLRGVIDDFAVFGTALTEASITNLVAGTLPTALPASTKLLAYWNFNDAAATAPTIGIAWEGAALKITYSGTLQSTATLGGQWNDVQGATSPYSVTPGGGAASSFYRAKQ